ncbi:MAG TPA: hypothetical protein PKA27_10080 [Fimbriimonadaceae bacterium]|nr:hypothetical protein [Fimbriimonadaceae bacterium]
MFSSLLLGLVLSGGYKVTAVEVEHRFEGRLGIRSTQILTVEKDGRSMTVRAPRTHSGIAGKVRDYKVGDIVRLPITFR